MLEASACTIDNCQMIGIKTYGLYGASDIDITGCAITECPIGIRLHRAAADVVENEIVNCDSYGMKIYEDYGSILRENLINGPSTDWNPQFTGLWSQGAQADLKVARNTITKVNYGVYYELSDYGIIERNTVYGNPSAAAPRGMYFYNSTPSVGRNTLDGYMKVGFTVDGGAYGGVPNLGTSGPDTSVACCTETLVPRCNRFVPDQAPQNHKYVSVLSDDTVDAYLNWWQSPWKPHFDDGRFDGPVNWDPMLDSDPGPQRSGDDAPQESALRLSLSQNCPNPFNPITTIRFAVPKTGRIKLTVYDIAGRQVRRLIDGLSAPGRHEATWDGRDDAGERVASGVYFLRLEDGHSIASRKLVLLK